MHLTKDQINSYDYILVFFSGGKDSQACVLRLLEMGVDRSKIELHHHDVDGREGNDLFDWACTRDYCKKFAQAFGLPIYFSWLMGGFLGEMLKENGRTQPIAFETPDEGVKMAGGKNGVIGTRRKFPQVSPSLQTRWCSSALKIEVGRRLINNQARFKNARILTITGERAEESAARAAYKVLDENASGNTLTRTVHQYRMVHGWSTQDVWDIIARFRVRAHPAYYMGFGRCSCLFCIFGNQDQFATAFYIDPEKGMRLVELEEDFGYTMKRKETLPELIGRGKVYEPAKDKSLLQQARSDVYSLPILFHPGEEWILPAGAFAEACGPI